jgi:hypothetical protein
MKCFKIVLPAMLALLWSMSFQSCKEDEEHEEIRSYRMGFQNSAPRFDDLNLFMQSLNMWTIRADAAIIVTEVPWEVYLSGEDFVDYVSANYKDLGEFYRSKNLELYVYIDPQNGLDRTADATALVQAGRSIAESEIQKAYERFVIVMDSILVPEHMGLALETNLIRDASTPEIYNGVKNAANSAAVALKARSSQALISVSVQADHAWGKLAGGDYNGVEQDFEDFPFIEELGISSYPYFGFNEPEEIPMNYYSRLLHGRNISVFISEGGWASKGIPGSQYQRTEELQRRYIEHHDHLLEEVKATAYFQLLFTDIDEEALPDNIPPNIVYFTTLGLVREDFEPKPALSAWDALFKRKLQIVKL